MSLGAPQAENDCDAFGCWDGAGVKTGGRLALGRWLDDTHGMAYSDNAQVRRYFDKTARKYDRSMTRCERLFLGPARQWATARARGEVLELAVGTGLSFPHYPQSARVLGVDLSEEMLNEARSRISGLGLNDRVRVQLGDVQALDVPGNGFDTVVSTYTFCTIPDPAAAAHEAFRVLRPGGQFLLVEHGPSANPVAHAVQRMLDPLFVRLQADHIVRDPIPYLQDAGFQVEEVHRTRAGIFFRVAASKPAA
jgi:ubiquinone/menaquinone biosynthesis C-methylase UbiE